MIATVAEMEAAALRYVSESGACVTTGPDADGWYTVAVPSGRRIRYHAVRRDLQATEVHSADAFAILGTEQGAGYDQDSALARIQSRLGTSSIAETIRRCVAVVDYYIGG
jgi:hypothetical protein